jgi:predicted transcriptional regulator
MKSITIHNMDDELAEKIENLARENNLSQNKYIKSVLREALFPDSKTSKKQDFRRFYGRWTMPQEQSFLNRIQDL